LLTQLRKRRKMYENERSQRQMNDAIGHWSCKRFKLHDRSECF